MMTMITKFDKTCMTRAISRALSAEKQGNLPIGAVIAFDQKIISEGENSVWKPTIHLHRHAEMEALAAFPPALRRKGPEMTVYTTLEPCMMCFGAIMLYQIGKVIYGSTDGYGGASTSFNNLPQFFKDQLKKVIWVGPASSENCDPLYLRAKKLENIK